VSTPPPPPQGGLPRRGEILPSNVGPTEETPTARPRGGRRLALSLVVLLAFLAGAGAILLWTSSQSGAPTITRQTVRPTPATGSAQPTAAVAPGVSTTARGAPAAATGALAPVNGISCDTLESTIFHIHVHLAVFFDGQEQVIPFGVGIGQPWQVSESSRGPFVEDGTCFYWLHTHTADGVIHIESPVRRRFTLGDFFAIWRVPISPSQIGTAQGSVITYVNSKRDDTNPAEIPLTSHQRIQLNVGQDVAPYPFEFAPGD
jgi:hypothetical protein